MEDKENNIDDEIKKLIQKSSNFTDKKEAEILREKIFSIFPNSGLFNHNGIEYEKVKSRVINYFTQERPIDIKKLSNKIRDIIINEFINKYFSEKTDDIKKEVDELINNNKTNEEIMEKLIEIYFNSKSIETEDKVREKNITDLTSHWSNNNLNEDEIISLLQQQQGDDTTEEDTNQCHQTINIAEKRLIDLIPELSLLEKEVIILNTFSDENKFNIFKNTLNDDKLNNIKYEKKLSVGYEEEAIHRIYEEVYLKNALKILEEILYGKNNQQAN